MNSNKSCATLAFLLACAFALVTVTGTALAEEKIRSFSSDITIHKDGSMVVTETIKVRAEGQEINRGIFRDFPTQYTDRYGSRYTIPFSVQSVRRDGEPEPHFTESISGGVRLYIGRGDHYLDPGIYEYDITYETDRTIGFFQNHDELYWNVTGNGWSFPIEQASVTINFPEAIPPRNQQIDGYTGYENSSRGHYEITDQTQNFVSVRTTRSLQPNQGLTVAVGWPKGIVEEPTRYEQITNFVRDNMVVLIGLGLLVLVGAYYLIAWLLVGVDPKKDVIIPRYEPPQGLSPAATRYVMNMGFDDETFASALVNLAVNGYVNIEENDGNYTVTKTRESDGKITRGERKLMNNLFAGGDKIELEQDNHEDIQEARETLEDELEDGYHREFFFTNTWYFVIGAGLSALSLFFLAYVGSGVLPKDTFMLLIWLTIWSIGTGALLKQTYTGWKRYFRTTGAKNLLGALFISLFALPFVGSELLVLGLLYYKGGAHLLLLILLFIGLNTLFYVLLKAPTVQGRKLMDKIQGFKRYLSVAEKNRLDLEELPEKSPELFERLLPYAIALGVGNEWVESFSDVLDFSGEGYRPTWYHGTFHSPTELSTNLSGSLSSTIATSSTSPSSSSGVGGGSVGGGVGGGGGGGW